jgi:hypothetical protein
MYGLKGGQQLIWYKFLDLFNTIKKDFYIQLPFGLFLFVFVFFTFYLFLFFFIFYLFLFFLFFMLCCDVLLPHHNMGVAEDLRVFWFVVGFDD